MNFQVNELMEGAAESRNDSNEYTAQFWLFFFLMILSWIGQAVVVTFADAICFGLLGKVLIFITRLRAMFFTRKCVCGILKTLPTFFC